MTDIDIIRKYGVIYLWNGGRVSLLQPGGDTIRFTGTPTEVLASIESCVEDVIAQIEWGQ